MKKNHYERTIIKKNIMKEWLQVMRHPQKKYQECDKRILTLTNQFIGNDPYAPPQSM